MAYLYVILAAVLFGVAPTVQRMVLIDGVSAPALMALTNGVTLLAALAAAALGRHSLRISARQRAQTAVMGCFMAVTGLLLLSAYDYLPVGFVTMIHFLYPAVVCVAMVLLFRERMTALKCAAIAVSVGGLVLLGGGEGGSLKGVLLAALSSLTYAVYVILNEKGEANALPLPVKLAYISGVSMPICLLVAAVSGGVFPSGGRQLGLSLLAGVLLAAAYFTLTAGIGLLGATTAAFINMLEPVTSLLVSAAVYHYDVSPRSAAGCALVLASVLLIALGGRRRAEKKALK